MENAQFFSPPQQIFHSRRILDPSYGVRLTGKVGRWAIGVLNTDDRAHPGTAKDSVLSIQREFLKDSYIRLMATDQELPSTFNRVASLDARLHLKSWFLTAQGIHSDSQSIQGNSLFAGLRYMDRHKLFNTTWTDRSPGFRSELGFIPRVDMRELKQELGYSWRPNKHGIVSYGPKLTMLRNWNYAGSAQDWSLQPAFTVEMPRLTTIVAGREESMELYRGIAFRKGYTLVNATTEWTRWLALNGQFGSGDGVNYFPAQGVKPSLSRALDTQIGVTLRPTPGLRLDESYLYTRLDGVFFNHILRSKVNYQFNREFSLRVILDYNNVNPNLAVAQMDPRKRLSSDFLFTWLLHPGTALYIGYTDIYEGNRWAPVVSTGRQAFVKLSYLFRF
jgi:hypothetical protein